MTDEPFHIHESSEMGRLEHSHLSGYAHAHYHKSREQGLTPVWFCGCPTNLDGTPPKPHDHCPNRKDD